MFSLHGAFGMFYSIPLGRQCVKSIKEDSCISQRHNTIQKSAKNKSNHCVRKHKLSKNKYFFIFIEVSFLTKFGVSNWSAAPCCAEAQNTNSIGKTEISRRINWQNRVNDFFLKLVSLMTIPAGLNFNLVDELNTNYAKFIRTFPPKLHYAVRIRNIRRNGLWSVPPILYFGKNGNVKRLFVKFVWSIIKQY